jgi:hypothetical protein
MEIWSISKACSYLMHILVQLINTEIMKKVVEHIEVSLNNTDNLQKVNSAILLLTASIGNSHKLLLSDLMLRSINHILKLIYDQNYAIKKNISQLLIKTTKHHIRFYDNHTIGILITTMVGCLNADNQIAINYCQSLMNIIKAVGDSETKKNSTLLSQYFESIFKELIDNGMKETAFDREHNLALYCFLTIDTLIAYSSHDKQAKLIEVVVYFLTFFENSVISPGSEMNYQLQSCYCIIFRAVLKKLLSTISKEIAERIYKVLEASFKQRQCVYEEALFTIAALATSNYIS